MSRKLSVSLVAALLLAATSCSSTSLKPSDGGTDGAPDAAQVDAGDAGGSASDDGGLVDASDACVREDEQCNTVDDDCDGLIDEDFDFASEAYCGSCTNACGANTHCVSGSCLPTAELSCTNGLDDDGDGTIDCMAGNADSECVAGSCGTYCNWVDCVRREASCSDGMDNDGDGHTDCGDVQDCPVQSVCRLPNAMPGSCNANGMCVKP